MNELLKAIDAFFADTSRSRSETREGLEEAAARIEMLLDALGENDE